MLPSQVQSLYKQAATEVGAKRVPNLTARGPGVQLVDSMGRPVGDRTPTKGEKSDLKTFQNQTDKKLRSVNMGTPNGRAIGKGLMADGWIEVNTADPIVAGAPKWETSDILSAQREYHDSMSYKNASKTAILTQRYNAIVSQTSSTARDSALIDFYIQNKEIVNSVIRDSEIGRVIGGDVVNKVKRLGTKTFYGQFTSDDINDITVIMNRLHDTSVTSFDKFHERQTNLFTNQGGIQKKDVPDWLDNPFDEVTNAGVWVDDKTGKIRKEGEEFGGYDVNGEKRTYIIIDGEPVDKEEQLQNQRISMTPQQPQQPAMAGGPTQPRFIGQGQQ